MMRRLPFVLFAVAAFTAVPVRSLAQTGSWQTAVNMASAREGHTATVIGPDSVLIIGGGSIPVEIDAEGRNPTLASPPASLRRHHTTTLLPNGDVLVVGGDLDSGSAERGTSPFPGAWAWSPAGTLAAPRARHIAALLPDGKVLIAGGTLPDFLTPTTSAELYDPATNTWSSAASLPFALRDPAAASLPNGDVLVVGGGTRSSFRYAWATGEWSTQTLAVAHGGGTATALRDGRILVAGGVDLPGYPTGVVEIFDPVSGTWSGPASLVVWRSRHQASLLASGRVLIVGGYGGSGALASVELYDPVLGTTSVLPDMTEVVTVYYWCGFFQCSYQQTVPAPRSAATLSVLQDGRALLAGGVTASNTTSSVRLFTEPPYATSIELSPSDASIAYDATQQFTATGTMSDGSTQNLTGALKWTSSDPSTATVGSGLATAKKHGATTIAAANASATASTTLTVTSPFDVFVAPSTPTIKTSATQQFTATRNYNDGTTEDVTQAATWQSDAASVATVDSTGLATGVKYGTATISATSDTTTGSATLTVLPTLGSITVTPAAPTVVSTIAEQFTATGNYADGTTADLTSVATWTSSNQSAASISSTGLATAAAPGTTTISAASDGVTGTTVMTVIAKLLSITVTPASPTIVEGASQQFTATGAYSDSSTKDLTAAATWTSTDTSVATVASGLATAVKYGTSTISAKLDGVSGSASLTVTPKLLTITVTPASPQLVVDQTQQFTATGTYSDNSTKDLTPEVTWSSSSPGVATLSTGGFATAVAPGQSTIGASLGGVTGEAVLKVAPKLLSISVAPAAPSIVEGATQPFTATGHYSDSSTNDLTAAATWASSDASVATITTSGLATAVKYGTSTMSATLGPITGSAQLVVSPKLVSVAVAPKNPQIEFGQTQQFTATGTYSDGSTKDLTASVTWSSSSLSIATMSSSGLATAVGHGQTTMTADLGGVVDSTVLTTVATLVSIAVTPANTTMENGATLQFTATGTYSDNSSNDVTGSAAWFASTPKVVTMTASGLATAGLNGGSTITATIGSISGQTLVTVVPRLLSIVVSPNPGLVVVGKTLQFTATGYYSDASSSDVTAVATWTSLDVSIATISTSGLATGVKVGATTVSASVGSVQGGAALTVTPVLVSIDITPASSTVFLGNTVQLSATGHYSDGSTQSITLAAKWTIDDATIGKVFVDPKAGAIATGIALGKTTVRASLDGVDGTAAMTVVAASLTQIVIAPSAVTIAPGLIQQFTATGIYDDGSQHDVTSSVIWTTGNQAVATITQSGVATAVAPGATVIGASMNGVTSSSGLTVPNVSVVQIDLASSSFTVTVGATQQIRAVAILSDFSKQDVSANVRWASDAPGIATIDAAGLATGIAVGKATISAAGAGTIGLAAVDVIAKPTMTLVGIDLSPQNATVAPGSTRQFTATGNYSDGSKQDITNAVFWQSDNGAVAQITGSGMAFTVNEGTATILATKDGVKGTSLLTVSKTAPVLAGITVSPDSPTISVGGTVQFSAIGTFSDKSTQDITTQVSWISDAPGVASITAAGLASGVGPGATMISATASGLKAATPITVSAGGGGGGSPTLTGIVVSPASPTLAVGEAVQFSATGTFSDASTKDITASVTWISDAPGIAAVDSAGRATGMAAGSTMISAVMNGVKGATSIGVTAKAPVLTGIAITPVNPTIAKGSTAQFAATGTYSDGSTQNLTSTVTWTSSNGKVATISTGGLATAVNAGTTTIAATLGGVSGGTTLTVELKTNKTVKKATPTVSSAVHDPKHAVVTSVTRGTIVHNAITVLGPAFEVPTGTVTVAWFASGRCTGKAIATSTPVALTNGAVDVVGFSQTPTAAGSYGFLASYSGDAGFTTASACVAVTVR